MKKAMLIGLMALSLVGTAAKAQQTTWQLDKSHSSIQFAVDHLIISETTGKFDDYTIHVQADKPDFTDAIFDFSAQVKSINTQDAKRDEHLRSPDFFDAGKYPNLVFKGKKLGKVKGNEYKVYGDLTMHGITKPIVLNAKFGGIVKDPWGGTRAGLKVWGDLDRYVFDLKYNTALEAGGLAIGQMVRITCNVELIRQ
ncbi:YceI family protein [Haliscomenobacter sp.]|uniref:YceI family protein n=1 Tax=Haliscomenobacter sp. TaxID=2717303 RepID=UPI003BAD2A46